MKTGKFNLKNSGVASRTDAYSVDPRSINVNHEDNPRNDYGDEDFQELKNSIKENGVKYPVVVYVDQANGGSIHLSHGFRRMKAVLELIKEGVPIEKIKVLQVEKNEETFLLDHITLNSGKPLTDLELGDALLKLSNLMGEESIAAIAKKSGYEYNKVSRLIDFAKKASTKLKKAVKEKKVSISNAISLVKATDGNVTQQNEELEQAEKQLEETGGTKIKIENISILKAKEEEKESPFSPIRKFISTVKKSKDSDLDQEFTLRLETLLNDIEDRNLTDKQIIGKIFRKVEAEEEA